MADKDEIDDIYEDAEEDELQRKLREAMEASTSADDDQDDEGIAAPMDEPEPDATVSQEEGLDLADKARTGKVKAKEPEPEVEAKAEPEPEPEDKPEPTEEKKPVDLETADTAALLEGVDPDRQKEITRRLDAAGRVTGLFRGHEAEMKMHGATPEQAVERFLQINRFAQERPDEYVAWIATQTGGNEPAKVLESAAKRLGFKLVPDAADEDDEFLDPAAKALKEENARLKAQIAWRQPQFGPDTPERVQARTAEQQLSSFVTERDPASGQPLRPHFDALRPIIAEMAGQHVKATRTPVTTADLDRFYRQAEEQVRQRFALPATSAAQEQPSVADQIKTQAAATAKSKAASKSIDGTGQGASRRPALPSDASLDEVLRAQWAAQVGQ